MATWLRAAAAALLVAGACVGSGPALYCPRDDNAGIEIDGRLDDSAWQTAATRFPSRLGGLTLLGPASVRVLWSVTALYVGGHCYDSDLRSQLTARDAHLWEEGDCFEFFLVLPDARQTRLEVELNPNAAFLDINHGHEPGFEDKVAWNWTGARWAVSRDGKLNDPAQCDVGWSGELCLPWRDLAELGIETPPVGGPLKVLFWIVNRNLLKPLFTTREQNFWPPLSELKLSRYDECATLFLAPPAG